MHGSEAEAETGDCCHYRALCDGDYDALRAAHELLFPIDYEDGFYLAAVRSQDGILSLAAIHRNGCAEELAGFITARVCPLRDCSITDRILLNLRSPLLDNHNILYILTLGVVERLRLRGIGSQLLAQVLERARSLQCLAVSLHVIDYNAAAIAFYQRHGFKELALLHDFYYIGTGRQPTPEKTRYNAYLYSLPLHEEAASTCTALLSIDTLMSPLRGLMIRLQMCWLWQRFWMGRLKRRGQAMQSEQDPELGFACASKPE